MKEEKNEKVEVYYERILKFANSLQHKTTIFMCNNNRYEERNYAVAEGNNFGL
jgi:hypothetical protein